MTGTGPHRGSSTICGGRSQEVRFMTHDGRHSNAATRRLQITASDDGTPRPTGRTSYMPLAQSASSHASSARRRRSKRGHGRFCRPWNTPSGDRDACHHRAFPKRHALRSPVRLARPGAACRRRGSVSGECRQCNHSAPWRGVSSGDAEVLTASTESCS
jgi:hypothetical protein